DFLRAPIEFFLKLCDESVAVCAVQVVKGAARDVGNADGHQRDSQQNRQRVNPEEFGAKRHRGSFSMSFCIGASLNLSMPFESLRADFSRKPTKSYRNGGRPQPRIAPEFPSCEIPAAGTPAGWLSRRSRFALRCGGSGGERLAPGKATRKGSCRLNP